VQTARARAHAHATRGAFRGKIPRRACVSKAEAEMTLYREACMHMMQHIIMTSRDNK